MKRLLSCSLLVLLGCYLALSQERIIDDKDYNDQMRKAGEYRLKENYRIKESGDSCKIDNCIWSPIFSKVTEYDHPGKMRVLSTRIDVIKDDGTTEWLFIDKKIYVKRLGTDWRIEEQQPYNGPTSTSDTIKVEYKDLGTENSGLDEMRVLVKTIHTHLTVNGEQSDNVQTIKSWIDRTGRLAKQEFLSTNSKIGSTRLTMRYELDPTIKIEVPIK